MMSSRAAPVAALCSAVALSGCGGGRSSGTSATSAATTPAASAPATSAPSTSTPSSSTPAVAVATPADQTVTVGQGALFSVSVAGATGYQWLKNGQAISGATGASYHTPPAAASDDGAQFSVKVASAAGSGASAAATLHINPNSDGSPPASFWGDLSAIPAATQVMTLKFINATHGKYPDSQVFWQITGKENGSSVTITHSIADAPTYDLPAINSARIYFYLAPNASSLTQTSTSYYDFIELNLGRSSASQPYNFNGDTTRVDAFGIKLAIRLRCGDGTDVSRGEDYGTFLEDRAITFMKYLAEVPSAFDQTESKDAPYRIVNPSSANFGPSGSEADYFNAYVDTVYANNGITNEGKPTPFLDFPDNQHPDLEAAIARHVADKPGTFDANGHLVNPKFWSTISSSSFYAAEPANFYARYWHAHGIAGKAYGFPYDDVGGYSSDIGCNSPQQLLVAVGW